MSPRREPPTLLESRRGRRPMSVAHRGFSAAYPENTLPAFAAAIPYTDYVETDVHRTRDGAAILVHDRTFRRTTDVADAFPGRADDPVGSFDMSEVERLDAGSWFGSGLPRTRVPLLREALELLNGTPCGMLLEVKEPIIDLVRDEVRAFLTEHPSFPIALGSIDVERARNLAAALPELPVGVLASDQDLLTPEVLRDYAGFARFLGLRHDRPRRDVVDAVRAAGLQVMHNTNTRTAMDNPAVDVHVSDDSAVLAEVIGGRSGGAVEAEDLLAEVTGPARVERRERADLSVTVPYKLSGDKPSGGAAAIVTADQPGDWCELTVSFTHPGSVDVRTLATGYGGRYQLYWDDEPVVEVETYATSPARRTVRVAHHAEAGSHRLRCVFTGAACASAGSELGIDVLMMGAR